MFRITRHVTSQRPAAHVSARMLKHASAIITLCALAGCVFAPGTPPPPPPPLDADDNPVVHAPNDNEPLLISDPQEYK